MSEHRILHVSVRADHGGGPRHLELLLRHAPEHVINHVACPRERPYWDRFADHVGASRMVELAHRSVSVRALAKMVGHVIGHRIDAIHTHGKGAGVYGRALSLLTGRPCVHTPHGIHVAKYSALALVLYRTYENVTSHFVEKVVFVSEEERASAGRIGLWPRTAFVVIPNGVEDIPDEARMDWRGAARRALGIGNEQFVVATLSRFDYQKNMQEACEIATRMPEALFVWAGDGPDSASLAAKLENENIKNVRMVGALDHPGALLAAADVYLSTSRWEGSPLSVLEAMAMGLPIVATDVTGHSELVREACSGMLYPSGAPGAASSFLQRLLIDPLLRQSFGQAARETQRTCYSVRTMAREIGQVYRALLSTPEET